MRKIVLRPANELMEQFLKTLDSSGLTLRAFVGEYLKLGEYDNFRYHIELYNNAKKYDPAIERFIHEQIH